ncbi:MAG: class I SAM-dependent methyltransferase [Desulfuromonadales bacterium]|nr:class I SAM-dependent methyltransferase [Desulfuromonadales bacterium]
MSSMPCTKSDNAHWLFEWLGVEPPKDEARLTIAGQPFVYHDGILRAEAHYSSDQSQTSDCFGFKWKKRDTFESRAVLDTAQRWLVSRYGDVSKASWWNELGDKPLLLDAGCGAGLSAIELFGERLKHVRYLGVDISQSVDVAAARFKERETPGSFVQESLDSLPFAENSVDAIFSEGVLHHTDSTRNALLSLAKLLRKDGRFLFYVYKKKGPIREFTDDVVREKLQSLSPEQAWEQLIPLTKLGKTLGELDIEIDVPDDIDLLQIPKGKINLQRLFYWHVFKAFYREDFDLQEMNHINFDWFFPANAHRQTPEEVQQWCEEASLVIEREVVEEAGITIVARKV